MENKFKSIITIPTLDDISEQEAKSRFASLKRAGIIKSGSYDDDKWVLSDEYSIHFFDFGKVKDLKEYQAVFEMDNNTFLDNVKKYIMSSIGNLSLKSLQEIILDIATIIKYPPSQLSYLTSKRKIQFPSYVIEFLTLSSVNDTNETCAELIEILEELSEDISRKTRGLQRVLASFTSYFRFNDIMAMFWDKANDGKRVFYFPLYLWWTISAIIPLRPREFILTPRNCLKQNGDKWFLTLRKNKIKGSGKKIAYKINEDYIKVTYQIPEKLAKQIIWYKEQTKDYPANELNTLFVSAPHYRKWNRNTPNNSRFYTYINLSTCLRSFYAEIIQNELGYEILPPTSKIDLKEKEIEYMHLGDTRHLALINIIAEGSSPLVASILAGHDDLNMTAHYYSNITQYIECKTYRLFQRFSQKGELSYSLNETQVPQVKDFVIFEDGRCYSPKTISGSFEDCEKAAGPSGEIGYCRSCRHHKPESMLSAQPAEIYKNRIKNECKNLEEIVRRVREHNGENETIIQVLMRLRAQEYSYQQFLEEKMENDQNGKK